MGGPLSGVVVLDFTQLLQGPYATQMLGDIVYQNSTSSLPFAAAIALIPVVIMVIYLTLVRRTGALDNL